MLAKIGAAICNRLEYKPTTEATEFLIDTEKLSKQKRPETTNDFARMLIQAGYPVVLGKRE